MMGPKLMMFFIFCFVVLTPISLMLEGDWLGSTEQTLQEQLTGMHVEQMSWFSLPVVGGLFWHGIPKLLTWDYSFWIGGLQMVRWILALVFSGGFIWAIIQLIYPLLANLFGSLLGGLGRVVGGIAR